FPDRVGAVALFHATRLVTDRPDSPHLLLPSVKASIYMGIAGEDPHFSDEEKDVLEKGFRENQITYTMEIYPEAKHGFAVPDTAVYDKAASERHFIALKTLFESEDFI